MFINKVTLYGNLTKDPILKSTQGGASVCTFTIATNRTFKDKNGQKQEEVQYHTIVSWGKTAENISTFMRKGSSLYIEGRLQTRHYDTQDGSKRYVTEVVAESVQFGPKKGGGQREKSDEIQPDLVEETPTINDDDLPF